MYIQNNDIQIHKNQSVAINLMTVSIFDFSKTINCMHFTFC